jgi:hypothetical protein
MFPLFTKRTNEVRRSGAVKNMPEESPWKGLPKRQSFLRRAGTNFKLCHLNFDEVRD